jgi:alpha-N-arabinofuranosidase
MYNDNLKSINSFNQQNVMPTLNKNTTVEDGMIKSMLFKASWNVIRLRKRKK